MDRFLINVLLLLMCGCSQLVETDNALTALKPALRAELLAMAHNDRNSRKVLSEHPTPSASQTRQIAATDAFNTQRAKQIIAEHGELDAKSVGPDGLAAFWLVLQHSTDDAFQYQMRSFVERLFMRGEIDPQRYAMYIDRVLVREGKLQEYGTQIKTWDDQHPTPYDIKAAATVNDRRHAIGLFPLEDYLLAITRLYFPDEATLHAHTGENTAHAGWLGIELDVDGVGRMENMTLKTLVVSHIDKASPALAAGLQVGDRIVSVEGVAVSGTAMSQLESVLNVPIGQPITMAVQRLNRPVLTLTVAPIQAPVP